MSVGVVEVAKAAAAVAIEAEVAAEVLAGPWAGVEIVLPRSG